jgi:hypothetical protein
MSCEPWDTSYKLRDTSYELWGTRFKLWAMIWDIKSSLRWLMTVQYGTCSVEWLYCAELYRTLIGGLSCPGWLASSDDCMLQVLYSKIISRWKVSRFIVRRPSCAGFCNSPCKFNWIELNWTDRTPAFYFSCCGVPLNGKTNIGDKLLSPISADCFSLVLTPGRSRWQYVKGTVQQNLRGVSSGINLYVFL